MILDVKVKVDLNPGWIACNAYLLRTGHDALTLLELLQVRLQDGLGSRGTILSVEEVT